MQTLGDKIRYGTDSAGQLTTELPLQFQGQQLFRPAHSAVLLNSRNNCAASDGYMFCS